MTIKKRLLSLILATVMLAAMLPSSMLKTSASFTGALQFDTAGKFTVMQIADVQSSTAIGLSSRVITLLENAIARYQPDLCVFTGDNQTGGTLNYKLVINKFLAPLIDTNTKFAVTFGNHDEDGTPKVTKQTQYNYYKSKGGSNFIDHDVAALSGVGSGAIPIYSNGQTSGTPAFQVYLMDSGMYASSGYDCPYTDQIDYYIQRSLTYPSVPSLWYMHIIVPDVNTEVMSGGTLIPEKIDWDKSAYGTTLAEIFKEAPCPAELATYTSTAHRSSPAYGSKTLYESWVAYGNMLGTYYGHDHKNSFVSTTDDGIDIGYGKAPTLESYNDDNPGCRIYELDEDGTYTTFNVTESDLAKAVVNFNANGGTGYMLGQLVSKNTSAALKSNIYTRPGYTFEGWATSANGSVVYSNGANYSIGTSDITLYAKWTASSFSNITFDANGGSGGTGPTAMLFGSSMTAPAVTRIGYTFTGWQPSVPATVPAADTAYIAQWSANSYTVEYNANGGTGSTINSAHIYDIAKALTGNGFSKIGHTFAGWATTAGGAAVYSNGQNVINLSSSPGTVINFYAVWTANQYTIIFDANGGTGGGSSQMTYGTALTAPAVAKTGFTFAGWQPAVPPTVPAGNITYTAQWSVNQVSIAFSANGGEGSNGPTMMTPGVPLAAPQVLREGYTFTGWLPEVPAAVPASNATYIAQWIINNYTITFDANGGTGGTVTTKQYGTTLTAPAVSRTGYNFSGWLPLVPATVPAANTTYTAQWTPRNYTITFNASGGTGGTSNALAFASPLIPPTVIKPGYVFTGWTPQVPATVPAENAVYTATWATETFLINFDANGGTGGSAANYEFGAALSAPAVTRTGYTFTGWLPAVPSTVPAANTTYTAQWSVNQYRITFEAAGGQGGSSAMLDFGTPLIPPSVTRYGYGFTGWSPAVPDTVPASNTTYTAGWTPGIYAITFDANGGIGGLSAQMAYGSAINPPAVTRFGYTLMGWSPSIPATVPGANTTYQAQWLPNNYTITFDANGGTGGTSASMPYESVLIAPQVVKSGYTLTGWSPELPASVPASNTAYVAQWAANSYSVYYNANGAAGVTAASTHTYDTAANLSANGFIKTGWGFIGWSASPSALFPDYTDTQSVMNLTAGSGDIVTLYAIWSRAICSVSFESNGGSYVDLGFIYYGEMLSEPQQPQKQGHYFMGWYEDAGLSRPVHWPYTVTSDVTFYAGWIVRDYRITFDANGGDGGTSEFYRFGASLKPAALSRTGYTFAGWEPAVPLTVPAQDTTYTAMWIANIYTITFDANGGTGSTSLDFRYGETITAPAVIKDGCTLSAWNPALPVTMPAEDLFVTAVWVPTLYDAIFMIGEVEYARIPTAFGSAITLPGNPEKPGSIFLGWNPGLPVSMPDHELFFTAEWFPLSFTVSFNLNGGIGAVPAAQSGYYGLPVALPMQDNITRQGYVFLGWATSPMASTPMNTMSMPDNDTVLYAVWSANAVLLAGSGSTTVIHQASGQIYGLAPGITRADFENEFVHIIGDARLVYTPGSGGFGTGTTVELIDNLTHEVIFTYTIVIFGDVNGDGSVDSLDAGLMVDVENYLVDWNNPAFLVFRQAGDLNGDGVVDSLDAGVMVDYENYMLEINQVTGTVI